MPTATDPTPIWRTFPHRRTVLGVVHNVTAATRLFDVLDLIAEDPRIEIVFTDPLSSAFPEGTGGFLTARGVRQLPWAAAREMKFDLAVAASHGHTLHELNSPLLIIPHGMGYNKYLETGNRKPETGNRKNGLRAFGRLAPARGAGDRVRAGVVARGAAAAADPGQPGRCGPRPGAR